MCLVRMCDRCKAVDVQVVPVLGKDLCNGCVRAVQDFMAVPPRALSLTRLQQAEAACRERGCAEARLIAAATGTHYRTIYYALMGHVRAGRLVHRGRGVFALPGAEAAE